METANTIMAHLTLHGKDNFATAVPVDFFGYMVVVEETLERIAVI
jgi:hypothetical protein